jgi:hypothetical protein
MASESAQLIDSEFLRYCEEYIAKNREFLQRVGRL